MTIKTAPQPADELVHNLVCWLSCLKSLDFQGGCNADWQCLRATAAKSTGPLAEAILALPERPIMDGAAWAEQNAAEIESLRLLAKE